MARKSSTMPTLGTLAHDFSLPDVTNNHQLVSLADLRDKPLLVMFICNHCPFVIHLIQPLADLANRYQAFGFNVIAISSNDIENYPEDAPDKMAMFAQQHGFSFPYCYDESQQVANQYQAACTPDFFVYDAKHQLQYRGQFDDSRPGNQQAISGTDLNAALQAVLIDELPDPNQIPSIGCGIKWRLGNEPDYF